MLRKSLNQKGAQNHLILKHYLGEITMIIS